MVERQRTLISNILGLEWGEKKSLSDYTDEELIDLLVSGFFTLSNQYGAANHKLYKIQLVLREANG
jgi:hypothetical protein